jgi:hypothetical protein
LNGNSTLPHWQDVEDPHPEDRRPVWGIRNPYQKCDIELQRCSENYDRKVKREVAKTLREAGLPTIVPLDSDGDEGFEVLSPYPRIGGHLVATTDSSVFAPDDICNWWAIEVNSPPLIFCEDTLNAVLLACKTLTSSFRYNVNETCGLHVHVGNGNDNFSEETTKNLMAFLFCFEPVIDKLHPTHRHNGNYCRSIWKSSVYGDMYKRENSVVGILIKIWKERKINNLLHCMSDIFSTNFKEAY